MFVGLSAGSWMPYSAGVRALRGLRPVVWCRSFVALLGLATGCYDGPGEPEPPPGSPGGLCYEAGTCDEAYPCEAVGKYCYDPVDPCRGVFCSEHGLCVVDDEDGLPVCMCDPGYSNFRYTLVCEAV